MKKLSNLFAILAVLLTNVACAAVAYAYCDALWAVRMGNTGAPASVALLYIIPYAIAVAALALTAALLKKKGK